jgi:hypothetical protein
MIGINEGGGEMVKIFGLLGIHSCNSGLTTRGRKEDK